MAENYVSTNMATGVDVKESLDRISSYDPSVFAWNEISSSVTVNLTNPTATTGVTNPGDYVIYSFTNGPSQIPSTLSPILLSLRESSTCISANGDVYFYSSIGGESPKWITLEESLQYSQDIVMYVKSDTAPKRRDKTFWFDTSMKNDANDPHVDMKWFNDATSSWESVYEEGTYVKTDTLDPNGVQQDIFKYVTDNIAARLDETEEFTKHCNNELTYIHVTKTERDRYATLISPTQLVELIANTYTPAMTELINTSVNNNLPTATTDSALDDLNDEYAAHITGHVTKDDINRWMSKADANHQHDYTTGNTKLDASQIVDGVIDLSKLPDEVKERYYELTSDPSAVFSDTSITDAQRKSTYHNGNAFYYNTTTSEGKPLRKWYRIIDQTKVGTANWEDGVVDFTPTQITLDWDSIEGVPTTLEEYGFSDSDFYTKTQIDNIFDSYSEDISAIQENIDQLNGDSVIEYKTVDNNVTIEAIGIQEVNAEPTVFGDTSTGAIPQTDVIIKTSDNKIYKTTVNKNSKYDLSGYSLSTDNAKESIGTGMIEVPLKEYTDISIGDIDGEYDEVIEYNGALYATGTGPLMMTKDGYNWHTVLADSTDTYCDNDTRLFPNVDIGLNQRCSVYSNHIESYFISLYGNTAKCWYNFSNEERNSARLLAWNGTSCIGKYPGKLMYQLPDATGDELPTVCEDIVNIQNPSHLGCILMYDNESSVYNYFEAIENGFNHIKMDDSGTVISAQYNNYDCPYKFDMHKKFYKSVSGNKYYQFTDHGVFCVDFNGTSDTITMYTPRYNESVSTVRYGAIQNAVLFNNGTEDMIIYQDYDSKSFAIGTISLDTAHDYFIITKKLIINTDNNFIPLAATIFNDQIVIVGKRGKVNYDDYAVIERFAVFTNINAIHPGPCVVNVTKLMEANGEIPSIDVTAGLTSNTTVTSTNGALKIFSGWKDFYSGLDCEKVTPIANSNPGIIGGWENAYRYIYSWTLNGLTGLTLPSNGIAAAGSTVMIDTTYNSGDIIATDNGNYQFSGWNKTDFTINSNTSITGEWTNIGS